MHVVSCQRPLAKPSSYNEQFVIYQSSSVSIPTIRRIPCRPFVLNPEKSLCVKYSQMTVVFLSIVSTEHIKLFIVQSGGVILDLWCTQHLTVVYDERMIVILPRLLCTHILLCLIWWLL